MKKRKNTANGLPSNLPVLFRTGVAKVYYVSLWLVKPQSTVMLDSKSVVVVRLACRSINLSLHFYATPIISMATFAGSSAEIIIVKITE